MQCIHALLFNIHAFLITCIWHKIVKMNSDWKKYFVRKNIEILICEIIRYIWCKSFKMIIVFLSIIIANLNKEDTVFLYVVSQVVLIPKRCES